MSQADQQPNTGDITSTYQPVNLRQENVHLNTMMMSVDTTRANTFAERDNLKSAILEAKKLRNQRAEAYASDLCHDCPTPCPFICNCKNKNKPAWIGN